MSRGAKKRSVVLAAFAVVAITAAGVGGAAAHVSDRKADTKIVVWEAGGPLYLKAIQPVVDAYEKQYPGVTVDIQPVDWGTFQQRVLSAAAADQLPCVMYSNSQVESAIAAANVMSSIPSSIITSTQLKQYLPGFTGGLTDTSGHLLFVPFLGGANQFYIRTNTPAGTTIPQTYSQWIAWGQKAAKRDSKGNLTREGIGWFLTPTKIPGLLTSQFASMVIAAGGQYLDHSNGPLAKKALFNSPAGLKVLQFMHDTIWKYRISNPPKKQTYNAQNPVTGFLSGRMASEYLGGWLPNALATLATGPYAGVRKTWDATNLAPAPDAGGKKIAMISTDGWGVPRSCDNQDLAWNFIKFMTTQQSYQTFFSVYEHPVARRDAMTSPAVGAIVKQDMPRAKHELALWTDSTLQKVSVAEPHHPANQDIFKTVEDNIVRAMDNPKANLKQALATMASQVNTVLARQ